MVLTSPFLSLARTLLARESEAARTINPFSVRHWAIVNPGALNGLGRPTAYKLMPGENTLPFGQPEASVMQPGTGMMPNREWPAMNHGLVGSLGAGPVTTAGSGPGPVGTNGREVFRFGGFDPFLLELRYAFAQIARTLG